MTILVSTSRDSVIDVFLLHTDTLVPSKTALQGKHDIGAVRQDGRENGRGAEHPPLPGFQMAVHTALVSV